MSKSLALAKVTLKGGFNLFWGAAICTIISSIEIVVIARLLSPTNYGIYAIALTVPKLINTFRDLGMDQSTIRYTANYKEKNQKTNVKTVLVATTTFEVVFGTTLSLITFLLAEFIGASIFHRPDIVPLIQMASVIIFADALLKTAKSAFIGCEKMGYHSLIITVDAVVRLLLMSLFLVFGLGANGAVLGFTLAYLLTGIIAMLLVYTTIFRKLHDQKIVKKEIFLKIKSMLRYGLPLSAGTILNVLLLRVYSFLIAIYVIDILIGNYHVAANFTILMGSLYFTPLKTVLFPTFSKIDGKKELNILKNVFQSSIKFASLVIVPIAFCVMTLSTHTISTFFGQEYQYTPLYLTLLMINHLFVLIGSRNTDSLINGQGKSAVTLKLSTIKFVTGVCLSLTLIPIFGILGLIFSNLIATIATQLISLWWIQRNFSITVNWRSSTKILTSAAIATIPIYLIETQLGLPNILSLIIEIPTYLFTYILTASMLGVITKQDAQNLKEASKALGPFKPIITTPLNLIMRLITKNEVD